MTDIGNQEKEKGPMVSHLETACSVMMTYSVPLRD